MTAFHKVHASGAGIPAESEVVEIGLLLPAHRADALLELSKRRHQSVAQILRSLIDRALSDEEEIATRWS